ncbi:hypothetical protein NDU88_007241 [Pleurodeles waltl]|uniref:Uncharacterized protein n=1 Tax=Pleurodeles waltl TaxID=8319 RepID=A0AAV7TZU1_PLEWA|nr:hypothetical protein NDU88_007241 [Pleurodeles waltl]
MFVLYLRVMRVVRVVTSGAARRGGDAGHPNSGLARIGRYSCCKGLPPDVSTASAQVRAEAQWGRETTPPSAPPGRPSPQREPPLHQRVPGAGGCYCLTCSGVDVLSTEAGPPDGSPGGVTTSGRRKRRDPAGRGAGLAPLCGARTHLAAQLLQERRPPRRCGQCVCPAQSVRRPAPGVVWAPEEG